MFTVDNDNSPVTTITNPGEGDFVSATEAITADATDDGTVAQVEFFVDGVSVGVDTEGGDGWSVNWDTTTAAEGPHEVSATATDDAVPAQTHTDTVNVTVDNSAPSVSVDDPGSPVSGSIQVTATVSASGSAVAQVEFFVGGASLGIDTEGCENRPFVTMAW